MDVLDNSSAPDPATVSYKQIVIRYGAIWGGAGVLMTLIGYLTNTDASMPTTGPIKYVYTFIGLGVAIWAIITSIRIDRDQQLGGFISLGRCVGHGALIGLIAGAISAIFMLLYVNVINPDFEQQMRDVMTAQYEAQGLGEEEIEMASKFSSVFSNPVVILLSHTAVNTVLGVIIGLIAGLFMKREAFPNR